MKKRVLPKYDGTHKTLFLQKSYREFILSNGEAVDRVLRYYYKDRPPSIHTMIRWAKDGLRKLPHERLPCLQEKTINLESIENFNDEDLCKTKWSSFYQDPEFWAKSAWRRLRRKSISKGYEFNITWEDLIPGDRCPVLGIKMKIGGGRGYESQKSSPSVDRFDNCKGYVKGNVRIISKRANSLKSDASIDELKSVIKYMRSSS